MKMPNWRCLCMKTCSINVQLELMKPYNPLQGIRRWGMLLKNMQKQKNHRKTQGTSAAHVHDRAHRHTRKSRLWHAARSNRSSPSFNTHYSEQQQAWEAWACVTKIALHAHSPSLAFKSALFFSLFLSHLCQSEPTVGKKQTVGMENITHS